MPVVFHYMAESPPCRLVEMVAAVTGVSLDKRYISLAEKEQLKEDYIKLNPLHKVPFIEDGELKINESRAISIYLIEKYAPTCSLYPKDPLKRAAINELLFFDVGTFVVNGGLLFRPIIFGQAKELNPEADKNFRNSLTYIEWRLKNNGGSKFLLGDELTLADYSIVSSLGLVSVMREAIGYNMDDYPLLNKYEEIAKQAIPDFDKINADPTTNLANFVKAATKKQS